MHGAQSRSPSPGLVVIAVEDRQCRRAASLESAPPWPGRRRRSRRRVAVGFGDAGDDADRGVAIRHSAAISPKPAHPHLDDQHLRVFRRCWSRDGHPRAPERSRPSAGCATPRIRCRRPRGRGPQRICRRHRRSRSGEVELISRLAEQAASANANADDDQDRRWRIATAAPCILFGDSIDADVRLRDVVLDELARPSFAVDTQ